MMFRIIVVSLLSLAAGATATYFYIRAPAPSYVALTSRDASEPSALSVPDAPSFDALLEHESDVATRAAVYELAAQADKTVLAALLEDASRLPDSAFKDSLLAALALRATELDAERGLDLVATLDLDSRQSTELGLLLFDALGPSAASVDQVISALPFINERKFRVEALARWAEAAPGRAFAEALAIDDWQLKWRAVERVAAVWIEHDRTGALVEADRLPDDNVGRAFRAALVRRLIEIDPAAMVAFVNASPEHETRLAGAVAAQLELMEPLEALGWAEKLIGRVGPVARRAALQAWGRTDPLAAFAYATSMPLGDERQQLLHAVATGYGRKDPDAALAWAESFPQGPANLFASVIAGIAQVDPMRALELAFRDNPPYSPNFGFDSGRMNMMNSVIANAVTSPGVAIADIADRALSLRDVNARSMVMRTLADNWMRIDPAAAFDWALQKTTLQEGTHEFIAALARYDPVMAAGYTDRVPPAMREAWIANVAQSYVRLDPQSAITWLQRYQGEPGHATGVAATVHRVAEYDPALAADLLATTDDSSRNAQMAAEAVATAWARQSQPAARLWVTGLAEGPFRDAALQAFMRVAFPRSIPDGSLLALFSSGEAKERALAQTIYMIGQDDRAEAQRLVDRYISQPELRTQISGWLDKPPGERGPTVYPGGVIIRN
jgi:hypothetical protein